jgi:hypothetical protein
MVEHTTYRVIIASAGDILVEGKIVCEVCNGINAGLVTNLNGISYRINKWEDIFDVELQPQEIVNQLEKECDILICLFHKRFGTSSSPGKPCNLESFLQSYDIWKSLKKPQILFFFKEVKVSSLEDIKNPQLLKVFALKDRIISDNILRVDDFKEPNEFCEKVQNRLDSLTFGNTAS